MATFKSDIVVRCNKTYGFMHPKTHKYYLGLVPVLTSQYYPHYDYEKAKAVSASSLPDGEVSAKSVKNGVFNTAVQSKPVSSKPVSKYESKHVSDQGMKTGRLIDNQLTALIHNDVAFFKRNKPKDFEAPAWPDFDSEIRKWTMQKILPNNSLLMIPEDELRYLHPFARNVLRYMCDNKFQAIAAQVPVAVIKWNVATAIDMIWTQNSKYFLVELKKCKNYYYEFFNGMMRQPLEKYTNCVKNQHQLQLCMTKILFETTFEKVAIYAMIIRVGSDGVVRYNEDGEILKTLRHEINK